MAAFFFCPAAVLDRRRRTVLEYLRVESPAPARKPTEPKTKERS